MNVYLDNAATTEPCAAAKKKCASVFERRGNPSSIHADGLSAAAELTRARERVAESIGAAGHKERIVFTSGGTEANNLALLGLERHLRETGKTHIITTMIEHPSVFETAAELERRGFYVTVVTPDKHGRVSADTIAEAWRDDTGLVSVMYVNNELGTANPVNEIGRLCRGRGALFHSDCVQAMGTVTVDVEEMTADFISISAHKFHGVGGAGALYAKDKSLLSPVVYGGGQEFGLRSGTQNTPAIAAMGAAAEEITPRGMWGKRQLRELFESKLADVCAAMNVPLKCNGHGGGITNMGLPKGVDGQTLVLALSARGIYASAGSACGARGRTPSRTLKAIGLTNEEAESAVRFSLDPAVNTDGDIEAAVPVIAETIRQLMNYEGRQ